MRSILLFCLCILGLPVQAALVDNGSYTTDTVSGLDWLDLTATENLSVSDALAANSGWRLATNSEVEDLFYQSFDGFYATNINGRSDSDQNPYADQLEDVLNWESLFGSIDGRSFGMYMDENAEWEFIGIFRNANYSYTRIYGLDTDFTFSPSVGAQWRSTLLVREVVPIPAAVWLFGSALISISPIRRKRIDL